MPKFKYKAKEGPDKIIGGVIEAANSDNAVSLIVQRGLVPIDVFLETEEAEEAERPHKRTILFLKKVKPGDVVLFTRQASDLIEAAVPILRTLQIIHKQTRNVHFKERIQAMYESVRDGSALSDALSRHTDIFPAFYVNMVRTGELSGKLKEVLKRLADYLESEQETLSRIRAALAYPAMIVAVGIITIFVLLSFVIPRLSVMFEDMGQELPLATRVLINISGFFASFWWLMLALAVMAAVYVRQYLGSPRGRLIFDLSVLRMPVIGELIRYVEVGRLSRTLGTLIDSGVVITNALNAVWSTVGNSVLKQEIMAAAEEVRNGSSLNEALAKSSVFPEMALNMIAVGEETGHLEVGFYKIADTYEREADKMIKTLVSLLGPVILIFIVLFVGFVVMAMLLPIFEMNLLI